MVELETEMVVEKERMDLIYNRYWGERERTGSFRTLSNIGQY